MKSLSVFTKEITSVKYHNEDKTTPEQPLNFSSSPPDGPHSKAVPGAKRSLAAEQRGCSGEGLPPPRLRSPPHSQTGNCSCNGLVHHPGLIITPITQAIKSKSELVTEPEKCKLS